MGLGRCPSAPLVAATALVAWTGANDPQLTWFGPTISHGPRDGDEVAITFDDGPNPSATLAVRDILDRYGVKATFFLVGKALDERPDIARALLDDGMLLGGHSYHHDQWRWLDPRYPELQRSIDAFKRQLGVCPRYYRPPHGQRTPFMNLLLHNRDMMSVTWDVSAGDWATDDAALIAERVLRDVRPGSVILLHDGLDGDIAADRSVIVRGAPADPRRVARRAACGRSASTSWSARPATSTRAERAPRPAPPRAVPVRSPRAAAGRHVLRPSASPRGR